MSLKAFLKGNHVFALLPTEDHCWKTGREPRNPLRTCRLTVHRLAARALIRSMEMEERESKKQQDKRVKKKVVELSVQSGVSSAFTAFVTVNKGNGKAIQGPLVRRNVPTPRSMVEAMAPPCLRPPPPAECNECMPGEPPMDPFLQLVSLQKASGCWDLAPALAPALGKTTQELEKMKPASANQEVWATVLSLIWLHGFKKDVQEEWELLAMKAVSWLGQNASCVEECMTAGNALLGFEVQKDALGL